MESKKPLIFNYHDYRTYLSDSLEFNKNSGISSREICKLAELSHSYLSHVLNHRRNLSLKNAAKIALALQLNNDELSYLKNLIVISDDSNHSNKIAAYNKIKNKKDYKETGKKELEVYNYLTQWHNVAIRELAATGIDVSDYKTVQQKLKYHVPIKEIEKSVKFLIEHGFLNTNNEKPVYNQKTIKCYSGIFQLTMGEYHKKMFELAAESLYMDTKENRKHEAFSVALSKDAFKKAKSILENALDEIEALADSELNKNEVFHFGVFGFPLTKVEGK